jgi:flagellar basal body-associated protein FliL
MAENEETTQEPEKKKKKKGKAKLFVIVALVVVVGAGAYLFLFSGSGGSEEAVAAEPVEGVVVDGATMTVALNGEDETHFVRVSFALVLVEGADSALVGNRIQLLQDAALTLIAGYTAESLRTPEGLDTMRADLSAAAQEVYPDGEVMRVVLTEVIVQ